MQNTVACPSCQRELRLLEELIGKLVKCSACGFTFTAQSTGPTFGPPRPEEAFRPIHQPAPPVQVPNEPFAESSQENTDRRKRRRSRFHREALNQVHGPAIGLLIAGIINWVESVVLIAFIAFILEIMKGGHSHGGTIFERVWPLALVCLYAIVDIVVGTISFFGATRMKKLTGYKYAVTSSILAMIPVGPCWMIRVPFGVWSMVVLCKPEVKDAFR